MIWDVEFTTKLVAGIAPKSTALTLAKFSPEIVTVTPPARGTAAGESRFTIGAAPFP